MLQPTSRRFLRELDEAPRENNLHYILQCPHIPTFGNQGLDNESALGGNRVYWEQWDKTKYYIVIFDQLQGHSRGLVQAPESCVRGPLTIYLQ